MLAMLLVSLCAGSVSSFAQDAAAAAGAPAPDAPAPDAPAKAVAGPEDAPSPPRAPTDNELRNIPEDIDNDWLTFYYKNPEPDKLSDHLKKWSDARILNDERAQAPLVGFLSQVFRQNPDRIKGWYLDASDFPPEDLQTIRLALVFSRTAEGDAIFREDEEEGEEVLKNRPPKVLEMSMTLLPTFDMLWGFYYATGSERVLERMIYLFRYAEMSVGEDVDIPEDYRPLYEQLPAAAHWALVGNAEQHPKVLAFLEEAYQTAGRLEPIEKEGVRKVLSELLPQKYPPREGDKEEGGENSDARK